MGYFAKKIKLNKGLSAKINQNKTNYAVKLKDDDSKLKDPNSTSKEITPKLVGIKNEVGRKKNIKDLSKPTKKELESEKTKPTKKELESEKTKPTKKISRVDTIVNANDEELIKYDDKINLFLGKEKNNISFFSLINFKRFIKGKRIVLVANSTDLLKYKNGKFIDGHDIVIRFNSYKINKVFTGQKTTIHASVYLQYVNLDKFVPIRFIISNRISNWYKTISELTKFKQSFILKYNHHNDISGVTNDKTPSTSGLVMLKLLERLGGYKEINLIGFNFYEGGEKSILRTKEGLEYPISKVHDYDDEKDFVMSNAYEYNKKHNIITYYGDNTH